MPFQSPPDGDAFIRSIYERTINLIDTDIWGGVDRIAFQTWWKNFRTADERYFGACLLDSLIYRSERQTHAMMRHLFTFAAPNLIPDLPRGLQSREWHDALKGLDDPGIRIIPVIKSNDPPTKSGPLLARLYRQHLGFNDEWMAWPWQVKELIESGIHVFIFIDDMLGTGSQFLRFLRHNRLDEHASEGRFLYLPLVATSSGRRTVTESMPTIPIVAAEYLSESAGVFYRKSLAFNDSVNGPAIARKFYLGILREAGMRSQRYAFGFGRLSLTYAFAHATPNNSLPLLWLRTSKWIPLFPR